MVKDWKDQPSENPRFDELELLAIEFQVAQVEEKSSFSEIDQFEKQLSQLSVRQVEIKRSNDLNDYSYFM